MSLFDKKREEGCCCGGNCSGEAIKKAGEAKENGANIKVLGSGCAKCNQLEENVKEALKALGMDEEIEHVNDFSEIAAYGVMTTPALVVKGKVVSLGKVLKVEEIMEILK